MMNDDGDEDGFGGVLLFGRNSDADRTGDNNKRFTLWVISFANESCSVACCTAISGNMMRFTSSFTRIKQALS